MNALLDFLATPRRLLSAIAVVLGLSLIVLLLLPSHLPVARNFDAQAAGWNLATPVSVDSDAALSVVSQRRLWGNAGAGALPAGAAPPGEEKALTPPDWRIAGVFSEHGQSAVLIATEGTPQPQSLRVGDSLPGGAKILAIHGDHVALSLNGRRLSLSTYPQ